MSLRCDAVFEGGGVRGIGHVGAACALEQAGYCFENLAGSSCGAIVAGLLAVGYRACEIGELLKTLDYSKFETPALFSRFGTVGKAVNLILKFGVYGTGYFETWFEDLLRQKGKTTFGEIRLPHPTQEKYRYKLQITASDMTAHRILTLPQDLCLFGLSPDTFPIAKAVTMSMSIPLFYMPYVLKDAGGAPHFIADGGLLSNYPIWMLDDGTTDPPCPTFGFKFVSSAAGTPTQQAVQRMNVISYTKLILTTMLSAADNRHISESCGDFQRSIRIPVSVPVRGKSKPIKSTDFSITPEESLLLFQNGYAAAERFLSSWNFAKWIQTYRCT